MRMCSSYYLFDVSMGAKAYIKTYVYGIH